MALEQVFSQLLPEILANEANAAKFFDNAINEIIMKKHNSVFWGDRLLTLDKSAGFLSDPHFSACYEKIRGAHLYDQYTSTQTISWRLHTLVWAAQSSLNLEGDFVECGVFKGDMAWMISQMIDLSSVNKFFYLYDSFAGLVDKYSSPEDYPDNPHFFNIANEHYNNPSIYPYVLNRFRERPEIKVIKGIVPDILHIVSPEKIAFLHVDLNSPAAELGALELLFPRVVPGGIVIFDDYGWKLFRRQKEVEDKFMDERGYKILELPTGQGLVVKRDL